VIPKDHNSEARPQDSDPATSNDEEELKSILLATSLPPFVPATPDQHASNSPLENNCLLTPKFYVSHALANYHTVTSDTRVTTLLKSILITQNLSQATLCPLHPPKMGPSPTLWTLHLSTPTSTLPNVLRHGPRSSLIALLAICRPCGKQGRLSSHMPPWPQPWVSFCSPLSLWLNPWLALSIWAWSQPTFFLMQP
jgi:hypothetical protein